MFALPYPRCGIPETCPNNCSLSVGSSKYSEGSESGTYSGSEFLMLDDRQIVEGICIRIVAVCSLAKTSYASMELSRICGKQWKSRSISCVDLLYCNRRHIWWVIAAPQNILHATRKNNARESTMRSLCDRPDAFGVLRISKFHPFWLVGSATSWLA